MVPLIMVTKREDQVCLIDMQLVRSPKKKESMLIDNNASSKEENGAKKLLRPCMVKVLEKNNVVMPKKTPRRLPPRNEVYHKIKLEKIEKCLKEFWESVDQVDGLQIVHIKRQDSVVHAAAMRPSRRNIRWRRVS